MWTGRCGSPCWWVSDYIDTATCRAILEELGYHCFPDDPQGFLHASSGKVAGPKAMWLVAFPGDRTLLEWFSEWLMESGVDPESVREAIATVVR